MLSKRKSPNMPLDRPQFDAIGRKSRKRKDKMNHFQSHLLSVALCTLEVKRILEQPLKTF